MPEVAWYDFAPPQGFWDASSASDFEKDSEIEATMKTPYSKNEGAELVYDSPKIQPYSAKLNSNPYIPKINLLTPTPPKKTFESGDSSTEEEIVRNDRDEEFEDFNS